MKNLSVKGLIIGLAIVLITIVLSFYLTVSIIQPTEIQPNQNIGNNIVEASVSIFQIVVFLMSWFIIALLPITVSLLSLIPAGYVCAKYGNLAPYKNTAILGALCAAIFANTGIFDLLESAIVCITLAMSGGYSSVIKNERAKRFTDS